LDKETSHDRQPLDEYHSEHYRLILFTDEAQFSGDRVDSARSSHSQWELNPHETTESNFQHRFSINGGAA